MGISGFRRLGSPKNPKREVSKIGFHSLVQTDHYPRKEITRYSLPLGVGSQNHRHIRPRRPLTESFVLPAYKRGVHPMPHQIERKFAFGPSALSDLAQAFDTAWLELRAWGVEANTDEQVMCIKTKVAQRIMEYATEGEHDVEHLKEFGLQGLPHLCAHRVGLPRRPS